MQHARGTPLPVDEVRAMYESGMTQVEIAEKLGTSQKVVWRFMKNHGIKARSHAKRNQYGEKNDYWKGGRTHDEHGYVYVKADGHPRSRKCGGYVFEHILVAESVLGRHIERGEVVHHINGNKSDNRPENLSVMSVGDHIRYHANLRNGKNPQQPTPITAI